MSKSMDTLLNRAHFFVMTDQTQVAIFESSQHHLTLVLCSMHYYSDGKLRVCVCVCGCETQSAPFKSNGFYEVKAISVIDLGIIRL